MIQAVRSSVEPEQISMRVKGVAFLLIPAIVEVCKGFGLDIPQETMTTVFEAIFTVVGFVLFIIGQVRGKKK